MAHGMLRLPCSFNENQGGLFNGIGHQPSVAGVGTNQSLMPGGGPSLSLIRWVKTGKPSDHNTNVKDA
jgi:hypothetical protein